MFLLIERSLTLKLSNVIHGKHTLTIFVPTKLFFALRFCQSYLFDMVYP